jgi:hypothetical protein
VSDTEGRTLCTLATSSNGNQGSTQNVCADQCQFPRPNDRADAGFKVDEPGPATFTVTVGLADDGCAPAKLDSYSQDFTIDVLPPGGDPPTPLPEVTGGEGDWQSVQTSLDEARARWSAHRPGGGYEFRYHLSCFCADTTDKIVAVAADGNGVSNGWYEQSVQGMFDDIQQQIDTNAHSVRVSFDAVFGFPAGYSVDVRSNIADEEHAVAVLWFGAR